MEVLHHVWALERATVAEVRDLILEERDVAYTTVMTVMKNLADKGYLDFVKEGRTYVYSPATQPQDVQHGLLRGLLDKVFHGSPAALVQTLVQHEEISDVDRAELRRILDQMEEDNDDAD